MRQELSIIEIIFPYIRDLLHTQAVYASTSHTLSFSYIFIGEANKNIDSAKDVRAQAAYLRHVHAACGIEHFCRK